MALRLSACVLMLSMLAYTCIRVCICAMMVFCCRKWQSKRVYWGLYSAL